MSPTFPKLATPDSNSAEAPPHDHAVVTCRGVTKQFGAGEAPLLIVGAGSKVHQIPYAEAYLQSVDPGQRRIMMLLPEGMLELDAPLTAEEKQQQKR